MFFDAKLNEPVGNSFSLYSSEINFFIILVFPTPASPMIIILILSTLLFIYK